jgi:hypothetical protein
MTSPSRQPFWPAKGDRPGIPELVLLFGIAIAVFLALYFAFARTWRGEAVPIVEEPTVERTKIAQPPGGR